MLFTYSLRPSHADKSNKQQETYADMTNVLYGIYNRENHTHRHLLVTLILTYQEKVAKLSDHQTQSTYKCHSRAVFTRKVDALSICN